MNRLARYAGFLLFLICMTLCLAGCGSHPSEPRPSTTVPAPSPATPDMRALHLLDAARRHVRLAVKWSEHRPAAAADQLRRAARDLKSEPHSDPTRRVLEDLAQSGKAEMPHAALSAQRMLDSLADAGSVTPLSAGQQEQGRAAVREILSRREFNKRDDSGWLRRLVHSLYEWLSGWRGVRGDFLSWVGTIVLYGILGAAIVGLLWTLYHWLQAKPAFRKASLPSAAPSLLRVLDPDDLMQKARTAAARQEYREAIRLAFQSDVVSIHRAAAALYDENLTNGEIEQALARLDRADLSAMVQKARQIYEPCWYGSQPGTAEDFAKLEALSTQVPS